MPRRLSERGPWSRATVPGSALVVALLLSSVVAPLIVGHGTSAEGDPRASGPSSHVGTLVPQATTAPQGALWTNVTTKYSTTPQSRSYGGMAFDAAANQYVIYGGEDGGTSALTDSWSFTPSGGWSEITKDGAPGGDAEPAMAYDSTSSEIVFFGGCTGINLLSSDCNFDSGYTYSGGTWASISGSEPTGVLAAGMSDDPADGGVLLFGGCDDFSINILQETGSCASNGFVDTTSIYTASGGWKTVSASPAPSAREAPGMAYDPLLGEVVLFGGSPNGASCLGDTWVFKGDKWTNITSTLPLSPPGRANFAMFYDAEAQEIVLFSGDGATYTLDDTWAFNGTWTKLVPPTSPSPRDGMGAGGGDATIPPVMFAGDVANGSELDDTWTLDVLRVNAAASPAVTDVGTAVSFTAVPIGGQGTVSGTWAFGDGQTSTVANTSHTYAAPGNYTATFTATDSLGVTAVQPVLIDISPLPTVSAAASPKTLTLGNATSFWANVTGGSAPITYAWNFGDSVTSPLADPTHSYAGPGIYSAQVVVTDGAGHSASASVNITVKAPIGALSASFVATPTTGLVPLAVSFVSTVTGGVTPYTYDWNFGDLSPLAATANVTHTYNSTGSFTAQLTVTDSVGKSSAPYAVTITVRPGPLSVSFTTAPTSGTSPLTVNFTSKAVGGALPYTYTWSFGDGSLGSHAVDPTHVYNYSGNTSATYTVGLTVTDTAGGGQQATNQSTVTVTGVAPLAITADIPASAATNKSVPFSASVTGGESPYTYIWNFGDGTGNQTVSGQNTTAHTFTAPGPYTVTVWVKDAQGHTKSTYGSVTVSATGGPSGGGGTTTSGTTTADPFLWAFLLGPPLIVVALALYAYAIVYTSKDRGYLGATGRDRPVRPDRSSFLRRVR